MKVKTEGDLSELHLDSMCFTNSCYGYVPSKDDLDELAKLEKENSDLLKFERTVEDYLGITINTFSDLKISAEPAGYVQFGLKNSEPIYTAASVVYWIIKRMKMKRNHLSKEVKEIILNGINKYFLPNDVEAGNYIYEERMKRSMNNRAQSKH